MRKANKDQMVKAIQDKKYYITKQTYGNDIYYTICKDTKKGFTGSEVSLSKERALEWIELGIEVLEL